LNRGLAGALGGYRSAALTQEDKAGQAAANAQFAAFPGSTPPNSLPSNAPQNPPTGAAAASGIAPDTAGKIYSNDEPSPLDPPSGEDRRKMMATILGEAGNEPQLGKNAVASVIRTRAVDGGYGGDTPSGVVTSPNQFEPWNTPEGRARMAAALSNPQQAAAADAAIRSAYGEGGKAPEDPTEGMTHFYSPKGQTAMGRSPPAWAGGDSVTIGGHVFNSPDDAKPTQVASNDAALPAGAAPTQGYVVPGQAAPPADNGVRAWALQVLQNPRSTPIQQQLAKEALVQAQKQETYTQQTDAEGNTYNVNRLTGQKTILKAAEKDPASVQEYEYYKKSLPAGTPAMDYSAWSDKKSRAAATSVTTNVDTKGPDKYDTVMGEGLAKSHSALSNGVEDAQARARDLAAMQGAVDAIQKNGGTTGGMGQAQIVDLKKTLNAGAAGLGITEPFDEKDISDKEFLTKFNRQIAGAQAKGAVGSRVTNFEMSNYLKANPGLEMSTTGNQRLIGIQSQIEQRNIEVGNAIRQATADAVGAGKRVNPAEIQKLITSYDAEHHVKDPVTGQDLTQSYTLPEFQKQPGSSNEALATDHSANIKKLGGKSYQKIDGVWHEM
jgi:spore germination cell wall hydrolase CwlJ-like protein